jgi:hypothetical protein
MGLFTNKYTLIAIFYLTSLAACGWLSYDYASTKVSYNWEQERVALNTATIAAMVAINERGKSLNMQLVNLERELEIKSTEVDTVIVEVDKEVIKYVKSYVTGECPVDNDRLRIKNTAIATTNEFAKPTITPIM